jgi:iodotyrosine deiodinase
LAVTQEGPSRAAPRLVPLPPRERPADATAAARAFAAMMATRRSIRDFSTRPVPRETIEACVAAAASAPSGANKQPWTFVAVSDAAIKREIRAAAEAEERKFYERRANDEWLADLGLLGTDASKPFLEDAPWLVVLFKKMKDDRAERISDQVYYVNESVGIAAGLFIAAVHAAGLATLTHTPSPMQFLAGILGRPAHERPFLLLPVGYPADGCLVPDIRRRPLQEVLVFDR